MEIVYTVGRKERMIYMEFSSYLKEKRIDKNFSIRKLAELSDVSAMYISELERGKREKPSPEVLKKLSEGLGETYESLMEAAGYFSLGDFTELISMVDKLKTGTRDGEQFNDNYHDPVIDLDDLFVSDSDQHIFFQGRLLTKEEKSKIRSLIEIVLKD